MDDLEGITHSLCFGHQIVNSPTSLPTPAYVASLYAERGRMIFSEWWYGFFLLILIYFFCPKVFISNLGIPCVLILMMKQLMLMLKIICVICMQAQCSTIAVLTLSCLVCLFNFFVCLLFFFLHILLIKLCLK